MEIAENRVKKLQNGTEVCGIKPIGNMKNDILL